jgi:hypothetical protein
VFRLEWLHSSQLAGCHPVSLALGRAAVGQPRRVSPRRPQDGWRPVPDDALQAQQPDAGLTHRATNDCREGVTRDVELMVVTV